MASPPPTGATSPDQLPPPIPFVTADGFTLRRLAAADFNSNYMQLLQQLTTAPAVSKETFEAFVAAADAGAAGHLVLVAEAPAATSPPAAGADAAAAASTPPATAGGASPSPTVIAATATLLVERKLVRAGAPAGHIEDVVVDGAYRGSGLGRRVVGALTDEARRRGCYKVILDCASDNVPFYERCGYATKELQMARYF